MAKKATKKKETRGPIHAITKNGKTRSVSKRFIPRDIIVIPWEKKVSEEEIFEHLSDGYEVRIGSAKSGIRIFPYLNSDLKTQRVVAQAFGNFREMLRGLSWKRGGRCNFTIDALLEQNKVRRKVLHNMKHITPDTMVECPNCGTTFRVGKKLV